MLHVPSPQMIDARRRVAGRDREPRSTVRVVADPSTPHRGTAMVSSRRFACALGPAGILRDKREGDGATPAGSWPLRSVLYRADRVPRPRTLLPVFPIDRALGWCDDPADRRYNRPVALPYRASAEAMWRDDHLYDVVVILGHNDDPPVPGRGSCIFFHLARADYGPTEGCVAVSASDMDKILAECGPGSRFLIGASGS